MNYVWSTLKYRQTAWIGDCISDLMLNLYTDADMAGDAKTNRSTSGVFVTLEGLRTRMAIAAASKR